MIKLLHSFLFGNVNNAGPFRKGQIQLVFFIVLKRVLSHNTIIYTNNNFQLNLY